MTSTVFTEKRLQEIMKLLPDNASSAELAALFLTICDIYRLLKQQILDISLMILESTNKGDSE